MHANLSPFSTSRCPSRTVFEKLFFNTDLETNISIFYAHRVACLTSLHNRRFMSHARQTRHFARIFLAWFMKRGVTVVMQQSQKKKTVKRQADNTSQVSLFYSLHWRKNQIKRYLAFADFSFLILVIVVTKSTPDLLKTELRLHVVVHVFAMNLWNMDHCFKFLTFEIFPSSLFLILVSNKIIGISQ